MSVWSRIPLASFYLTPNQVSLGLPGGSYEVSAPPPPSLLVIAGVIPALVLPSAARTGERKNRTRGKRVISRGEGGVSSRRLASHLPPVTFPIENRMERGLPKRGMQRRRERLGPHTGSVTADVRPADAV